MLCVIWHLSWVPFGCIGCVLVRALVLKQQQIKAWECPRAQMDSHPVSPSFKTAVKKGNSETNPGSISSVISVESQHQYDLMSQSSRVSVNPHRLGLKTLKKPCSRGTLHFCSSVNLPWPWWTVSLCCGVRDGQGGEEQVLRMNVTQRAIFYPQHAAETATTKPQIHPERFLLAVWKKGGFLLWMPCAADIGGTTWAGLAFVM